MATHSTKTADIQKKWILIDATGLVVGRLATIIAMRLRGKHKPSYTPHMDDGDNVIVINAAKVRVHRPQAREEGLLPPHRLHRRHQGAHRALDPRGQVPRAHRRKGRGAHAAAKARSDASQFGNLRVYPGADHPHAAQQPEKLDIASMNRKNMRAA